MKVTKETAKLAKEKGFRKDSFLNRTVVHSLYGEMCTEEYLLIPTQSELWQWLIDEHKLFVLVSPLMNKNLMYEVDVIDLSDYMSYANKLLEKLCSDYEHVGYKTNTEAFEVGLQEALKSIKKC